MTWKLLKLLCENEPAEPLTAESGAESDISNLFSGDVLYALRSFPTDITEDFCDDFIDI